MKNKAFIRSLYHAACIAEEIAALEKESVIKKVEPADYCAVYSNCVEKDNSLYSENGSLLAPDKKSDYYVHMATPWFPSVRFYKLDNRNGTFIAVSCWSFVDGEDGMDNGVEPQEKELFLKTVYKLAQLRMKVEKIMQRECVNDYLECSEDYSVCGFLRNGHERNGKLYDKNGAYLAEFQNDKSLGGRYFVNQNVGYLEDDYYGEVYFEVGNGLYVIVAYQF